MNTEPVEHGRERARRKTEVFEETKGGQMDRRAEPDPKFPSGLRLRALNHPSRIESDQGGTGEKSGETPVPPSVKEIASQDAPDKTRATSQTEIQREEYRGEKEEGDAVKKHFGALFRGAYAQGPPKNVSMVRRIT
jgi:hypothetical protein